uniref:F-box domain-containing protein n=1 Tax=Solanum tuberosum TaxID=4113 RepID=M1DUD0_SOLTU
MRTDEEENYPQLPDKLIFYILSNLPLSSLFKFRSVCKLWNTLFLHPHLAFLHYRNSESGLNLDDLTGTLKETENTLKDLENEDRDQVELDIPNPSLCIALDFVFDSLAVKLVSVHEHGYEIGRDKSTYCWRDVKLPNLHHENNNKRNGIQVFFRTGVAYCIWHIDNCTDIEIDVLDMINETYIGHTILPRGFFTSPSLMDWNGQLSFVEQVNDELRVLVLNDYRKLRWDETTRIMKLNFLMELMTFIAFADNSVLFYMKQDKKSFCSYDMNTEILNTTVLSRFINSSEDVMDVIAMMMFFRCGVFFNY